MEKTKYSSQQLLEATESANRTLRVINSIFEDVAPVVGEAVGKVVGKMVVMDGREDARFVIRGAEPIISHLGSFIILHFVDDEAVASIRKSDLTKEEQEDGQWNLIRAYRKGEVSACDFCNGIDLERTDSLCFTLRMALSTEDVAAIYESESFDLSVEDGRLIVRAGQDVLGRIPV